MLGSDFGAIRPWELKQFTPHEEQMVHALRRHLEEVRLAEEV